MDTQLGAAQPASSQHIQQAHARGFVAVHVGAGLHASKNKSKYLDACRLACQAGIQLLRSNQTATATSIVEHMIRILEDDPVSNAGIGSNLNIDGRVECDASIMNGTTLGFGSVGAVSDFKNPISVAVKILEEADQGPLSLGRIPPIMLVGAGVTKWVDTMGLALDRIQQPGLATLSAAGAAFPVPEGVTPAGEVTGEKVIVLSLVTTESLRQHIRFQSMLNNASPSGTSKDTPTTGEANQAKIDELHQDGKRKAGGHASSSPSSLFKKPNVETDDENLLQDTVGAICVDSLGRVAAGVSSGGIAMKFPGRVSEAALFGAGCWAQDPTEESAGFACSMTGAGEQICKTLLARTCMETMVQEDDTMDAANSVLDRFIKSPLLRSYDNRFAGFISVKVGSVGTNQEDSGSGNEYTGADAGSETEPRARAEFIFAHTTKTMGVAYMSIQDIKPTAIMSQRKPESNKVVFGRMVKI